MNIGWDDLKTVFAYVLLGLVTTLFFFFKGFFRQHRKVYDFYLNTKDKCNVHEDAMSEISDIKLKLVQVDMESKNQYKELLLRLDNNHRTMMSKFNDVNTNFNQIESKLDKLDKKIDLKQDKNFH